MAEAAHFQEQAERCRRLARWSTSPLRAQLLTLADEFAAKAAAAEIAANAVVQQLELDAPHHYPG
jgi:hypothetical protein